MGGRLAVIGSRDFGDREWMWQHLDSILDKVSVVASGGARGADKLGELWAKSRGVPFELFEARWDDLDAPGAVIKTNRYGKRYNANAGFERNKHLIDYAQAVFAYWDGISPGTKDSIDYAYETGKLIQVFNYNNV